MSKIKESDCSVERIQHNGILVVSAIVGGVWVSRRYMGYTRKEAVRMFREEVTA